MDEHLTLLAQVASLLPSSVAITVLGDGEFDSCQLQEFIKNKGWTMSYVQQKNTYIEDDKGDIYQLKELSPYPKMDYLWIENCSFTKKKYGLVSCLIWHHPTHKKPT